MYVVCFASALLRGSKMLNYIKSIIMNLKICENCCAKEEAELFKNGEVM